MPIYEYICKHCGERFERLRLRAAPQDSATCPHCGSEDTERAVSSFASPGSCAPAPSGYS
ncbi:MAG: zinc ribbon domain-containing protein [Dehalococcoidia bacterium]|nr:zinc ribbon domain-containing protein [Dehalococcoidia bacterium]